MPARCFLAIDLPPAAVRTLRDVSAAFLEHAPAWAGEKWVRPEILHLTLKFIGPMPDGAVGPALERLAKVLGPLPRPRTKLSRMRAVPSPRRASMLWATFDDPDGAAAAIAAAADRVLAAEFGVPSDARAFSPHVTLARARSPRPVPQDALPAAQARLETGPESDREMSVRSCTLYASTLGPDGPAYRSLGTIGLGA
ncbi:MAG TPA: RNA 2',3'-cyclic phosphodiesterase [Coriobacteriia bacterium]